MDNIKKYELKIQALREALESTVSRYEDKIADLRVEITEQGETIQMLVAKLNEPAQEETDVVWEPQEADRSEDDDDPDGLSTELVPSN